MSIEEDLRTYLLAATTIQTVVGDRIHHNHVPESSDLPYVWYRRSSEINEVDMDGPGGLFNTEFDIECYAADDAEAQELGDSVRARLNGVRGTVGASTVQGIFVTDKDDDYIPRGDASDDGLNQVALTANVWHF
jgi:hypothetical protein